VYFAKNALDPANRCLVGAISRKEPHRRHRMIAVVDRGLAAARPPLVDEIAGYVEHHAERIDCVAPPVIVDGGEAIKNDPQAVSELYRKLDEHQLDRHSFVLIIGGGAVLDMAGFAAATAHRGVRVVRMPTTVLSQADSGIGVKNGVNALGKKNFIGSFAPPFAVIIDTGFLATLSPRDAIAGMAEAVKVALVRDASFFAWLQTSAPGLARLEAPLVDRLVERCAELHLDHIATSGDPFELGSARPLDFGHWAAHKLEVLTEHRLRHGEAVAIGMAIDTLYSREIGSCDQATALDVLGTLRALGLPSWDEALERRRGERLVVLDGLAEFREHVGGELSITLLQAPGKPVEVSHIDDAAMARAIGALRP
jgi:3-dehydroquinate synthase